MLEIIPGIWFVEGENRGRYPYAHSLFIEGEVNTLIDTGAGPFLADLAPKTGQVLLTHYHRDHVTYNQLFSHSAFAIHNLDAPGVESLEGFYRLSGLDAVDIKAYWRMVRQSGFLPTRIDRYLKEGSIIETGRFKITTMHLPGHTAGHCGFYVEEEGLLYAADVDLTSFGPWYGNTMSDPDQFRASIRRLRQCEPEIIVTGHCPPQRKGLAKKLNVYEEVLDRREEKIIGIIKNGPVSLEKLAREKIIYRTHNGQEVLLFFEKVMLGKHLESMIRRGIAAKQADGRYTLI